MIPNILVTFLLVTGPGNFSSGETLAAIAQSKAQFAEAGINLKVNRIIKIRDRYESLQSRQESNRKFWLYRDFIRRAGYGNKGRVHAILPPMYERTGIYWIAGRGEEGCNFNGFSSSNGWGLGPINGAGGRAAITAITHEIAHTLGAEHIDSCGIAYPMGGCPNIMHSNALAYAMVQKVSFLQRSIRTMKECLKWG